MKLTYDDYLQIVEDYKKIGGKATARKWLINYSHVKRIIVKYRNNCLYPHSNRKNLYSPEFKLKLVKAYIRGEGSFEELANRFGVCGHTSILYWYHIYQSKGEEGLRNMKKAGRPRKVEVNDNKNKVNLDSLLSSDKEEYTKEEIKALKEELLRLRCHEEFSKKFEALAQDYLRKKTNK
ncbi:transposase [Succinivibrio sp.]|uniref:transposase n=1 Tax=Succinivibrio sp. TaxID=2053619 RepID=UPI0025CE88C2|nr:transposase [Succinivibrio sp.]MBQ9221128.1 transposase [Succinivibrio sp.]